MKKIRPVDLKGKIPKSMKDLSKEGDDFIDQVNLANLLEQNSVKTNIKVSAREIMKEAREHPELVRMYGIGIARQIALDHAMRKTTTKEGKRIYMREYMRQKRSGAIPDLTDALGLQFPSNKERRRI